MSHLHQYKKCKSSMQFKYKNLSKQCVLALNLMGLVALVPQAHAAVYNNVTEKLNLSTKGVAGKRGNDSHTWAWSEGSHGEAGKAADAIHVHMTPNADIDVQGSVAIGLNSIGGEGGRGGKSGSARYDKAGGSGGAGGNIALSLAGKLVTKVATEKDHEIIGNFFPEVFPAIQLHSQGGKPGVGATNGTKDRSHGGKGGNIELSTNEYTTIVASKADRQIRSRSLGMVDVRSIGHAGIHGAAPASGKFTEDGSVGGAGGNITTASKAIFGDFRMEQPLSAVMHFVSQGGKGGLLDSRGPHRGGTGGAGGNIQVNIGRADPSQLLSHTDPNGVTHSIIITANLPNTKVVAKLSNRAKGIVAQSLGGAGGEVSNYTVAWGPKGGHGGNGGQIGLQIQNTDIEIHGKNAIAVEARSIGGNGYRGVNSAKAGEAGAGGKGGMVSVQIDDKSSIEVGNKDHLSAGNNIAIKAQSIGGSGAQGGSGLFVGSIGSQGGAGGQVTVDNAAEIEVYGHDSKGIYAASLGGSAGDGGTGIGFIWGEGGSGGKASHANNVTVTNRGKITVAGDNSQAIFLQSIGGGGGYLTASDVPNNAKISIGNNQAQNSASAKGGAISLINTGSLSTQGINADAILAQSIGGGGGSGGSGMGMGPFVIGGNGAAGSHGQNIKIHQQGDIQTQGEYASAIEASSIGGGGGDGGRAMSFNPGALINLPQLPAIAIGGQGSVGARGGHLDIHHQGNVRTKGDYATGVLLTSIGGGGGNGGDALSVSVLSLMPAIAIGGNGASGAHGGNIVYNDYWYAYDASGIPSEAQLRQKYIDESKKPGFLGLILGNSKLTPTQEEQLELDKKNRQSLIDERKQQRAQERINQANLQQIETQGQDADAISAKSIGGGGGDGGNSNAVMAVGLASLSVGGMGGGSELANGGSVTLNNVHYLRTLGDGSKGIFAQSIGGGGGNGGKSFATTVGMPVNQKGDSVGLSFAIGGQSGGGGNGGKVTIHNDGGISTLGQVATGISAQSIGGGGGSGGSAQTYNLVATPSTAFSFNMAIGGSGGQGGQGGDVEVVNQNTAFIRTFGQMSDAIKAQSIGGGGGDGGSGESDSLAFGTKSYGLSINSGGGGGGGGSAGRVTVTNKGSLLTAADLSRGIFAQSIGGGGGTSRIAASDVSSASGNFAFNLGGRGGNGGHGGKVVVIQDGGISTDGAQSEGVLALSVGGGGGDAGRVASASQSDMTKIKSLAQKLYKEVMPSENGDSEDSAIVSAAIDKMGKKIKSSGNASNPSKGKSVGLALNLGGKGGKGGKGGDIQVNTGSGTYILTSGHRSSGVGAMSIGGGGGKGGSISSHAQDSDINVNLNLGGLGGAGNQGGNVQIHQQGYIQTQGLSSHGIFAQSIGGGGGSGGNIQNQSSANSVNVGIHLGGVGGVGADGGMVKVSNAGEIQAASGHAIFAQSIGGGGGDGGSISSEGSVSGSEDEKGESEDGKSKSPTQSNNQQKSASNKSVVVGLSLGGPAQSGGRGGDVHIDNQGVLSTEGDLNSAIVAQSIGGGGGTGGAVTSQQAGGKINVNLSVGGMAKIPSIALLNLKSDGNNTGGNVIVNNTAEIWTRGTMAHGIHAQSIGGSGGKGGSVVADGSDADVSVGLSLGGFGGSGAAANTVSVTNTGSIHAHGKQSYGIFLQSIGGGGGSAGHVNQANKNKEVAVNIGVGGVGASGANGGKVILNNTANHIGASGIGLLLQSIGGGGGDGGNVVQEVEAVQSDSSEKSKDSSKQITVGLAVGGLAGVGGNGGAIELNNQSSLSTGDSAILAQSIGGGGGNGGGVSSTSKGGDVSVNLSIGANGNKGGDAGGVSVTQLRISPEYTSQIQSGHHAIVAQAIGGGGGNGSLIQNTQDSQTVKMDLNIGGKGGQGGQGGEVHVSTAATVVTFGQETYGVLAQSIGGGGGHASLLQNNSQQNKYDIGVNVGGSGGSGGAAKNVLVEQNAYISGNGHGIVAQSIGGGGGVAHLGAGQTDGTTINLDVSVGGRGGSGGVAGNVVVRNQNGGHVYTYGNQAYGILAQSIGGGGGLLTLPVLDVTDSLVSGQVQIGGQGGNGNHSGNVEAYNFKNGGIKTNGNNSHGIVAQSIGGGGGIVSGLDSESDALLGVQLSLGNHGGKGAHAGDVKVVNEGHILTDGDGAYGVLAQSLAGGGGFAADSFAKLNVLSHQWGIKKAGAAKQNVAAGDSGNIDVQLKKGYVQTLGDNSVGIFAQSSGAGETTQLKPLLSKPFNTVVMPRKQSNILIQLGEQDEPDGQGSIVENVGQNSVGIYALNRSSHNSEPTGDIAIEIHKGSGVYVNHTGTGIVIDGGLSNRLWNAGHIRTGDTDAAVWLKPHQNSHFSLENTGLIRGSLQLNHQSNIYNLAGGELATGRLVSLSSEGIDSKGTLYNAGIVSPAGVGYIGQTTLDGHYQAIDDGVLVLDVSHNQQKSDIFEVLGNSNQHETSVIINTLDKNGPVLDSPLLSFIANGNASGVGVPELPEHPDSPKDFGSGGVTIEAIEVPKYDENIFDSNAALSAAQMAALEKQYRLTFSSDVYLMHYDAQWRKLSYASSDAFGLMLTAKGIRFNQNGLSGDQARLARYLGKAVSGDSSNHFRSSGNTDAQNQVAAAQARTATIASSHVPSHNRFDAIYHQAAQIKSLQQYRQFLEALAVDTLQAGAMLTPIHSQAFVNKMLSCQNGNSVNTDNGCMWLDTSYDYGKHNQSAHDVGFNQKTWMSQMGMQQEITPNLLVGGSLGFENASTQSSHQANKTDSRAYHVGMFAQYLSGPWQLGMAVNTQYADHETKRILVLPLNRYMAKSQWDAYLTSVTGRVAYDARWGALQMKPHLNISTSYQSIPEYQEQGADIYGLHVDSQSRWNHLISPGLDVSYSAQAGDWTIRPYASFGMHYLMNHDWQMKARFVGANADDRMHLSSSLPRVIGTYQLGLDVMKQKQWDLKFQYEYKKGGQYNSHGGRLRAAYYFN